MKNYKKFAEEIYNADYFTGNAKNRLGEVVNCNYEKGFNGEWYAEVVKWLNIVLQFNDKSVLDVGCAVGSYLNEIQKLGGRICGIDISEYAISKARQNLPQGVFIKSSAENIIYIAKRFDIIYTCEVFEHIPDKEAIEAFIGIRERLKNEGIFYFQVCAGDEHSEEEDAGHINIKPFKEWQEMIEDVGFEETEHWKILKANESDFIKGYQWQYKTFKRK